MSSKDDDETAKSVRSNGHPSSGGHAKTTPPAVRQATAFSRINRSRWDMPNTTSGDDMPYQFYEYPKHVYPHADRPKHYVLVNNAEEEREALGGEEVISEEDERTRLLTLASVNKVPVDKRWGPAKITKAIEDAGFDPTANPFE